MTVKKYVTDLNKTKSKESISDYSERMYRENKEEFGKPIKPNPSITRTFEKAEKQTSKTWNQIRDDYDAKYGKNHHHLKLVCEKCNNQSTCRCKHPKTTEKGICPDCE
jgi:Zn-dependent M32 family carboxypeptidase